MSKLWLRHERAALVVVDFQEKLAKAMPAEALERATKNVLVLLEAARRMRFSVILTEQYPKGLGHTIAPIQDALAKFETKPPVIEKVYFDACSVPSFLRTFDSFGASQVIVVGMEAHVCVYQTVRGLGVQGLAVHVPLDAVVSRAESNVRIAAELLDKTGAIVTSTETVIFDLLGAAEGETFKALSKMIK
ncbi:MAG: isochorismatase family protein [Deltaproteobacteria bacterium]|nr:isochorismatase family protein [Deltaproteobacteria bacterium]